MDSATTGPNSSQTIVQDGEGRSGSETIQTDNYKDPNVDGYLEIFAKLKKEEKRGVRELDGRLALPEPKTDKRHPYNYQSQPPEEPALYVPKAVELKNDKRP